MSKKRFHRESLVNQEKDPTVGGIKSRWYDIRTLCCVNLIIQLVAKGGLFMFENPPSLSPLWPKGSMPCALCAHGYLFREAEGWDLDFRAASLIHVL